MPLSTSAVGTGPASRSSSVKKRSRTDVPGTENAVSRNCAGSGPSGTVIRRAHLEAHNDAISCERGGGADRRRGERGVDEVEVAAGPREVEHHVGPLTRSDQEAVDQHRGLEEPAVGAQLRHRCPTSKLEVVEAGVGAVEDPHAVLARLDVLEGPHLAVDANDVSEELRRPLGRILDPTVLGEGPVLYDKRDLVVSAGQLVAVGEVAPLSVVDVVAQEVDASEPSHHVQARDAQGV